MTKNVHMSHIGVTEGKSENLKKKRQNEDKHRNFHLHNILYQPEGVHNVYNPTASSC